MVEFLFSIVYLLWLVIKGVFKLIWLIVSFPFKTIKRSHDKKIATERLMEEQSKKDKYVKESEKTVENLFQKIKNHVYINNDVSCLPIEIIIYSTHLDLFYENETQKILYSDYDLRLHLYDSYWCTDGTESDFKANQLMLFAKKLNMFLNDSYNINDNISKTVSEIRNGVTMHHYIQQSVKMTKNS